MLNAQFPDPKHASFSLNVNCYLIGIFYFAELIVWLSFQFQDSLEIAKVNDLKYLERKKIIESEIVWLQELSLQLAKMSLTMERAKMKTGPFSESAFWIFVR